jgi:hypothetical protein
MKRMASEKGIKAVAYMCTSSATNVGADNDSEKRQRAAISGFTGARAADGDHTPMRGPTSWRSPRSSGGSGAVSSRSERLRPSGEPGLRQRGQRALRRDLRVEHFGAEAERSVTSMAVVGALIDMRALRMFFGCHVLAWA